MVNDHTRSAENWKCVWYFLRPIDGSSACAKRRYTLQLHSVSNGLSGEPAAPTAEFIIVVSNVAASRCFEWTSRVAQEAYLEVEYIRNVLSVSGTLKYADSGTA